MSISVIISTYNRKSLTGITLDAVMACKHKDTKVIVLDDCSDEYSVKWLKSFGVDEIQERYRNLGIGLASRMKFEYVAHSSSDFFILLDNDALVTPEFDTKSVQAYNYIQRSLDADWIFSPYRSTLHEERQDSSYPKYALMKDIGGISMAMDGSTAQHILAKVKVWDEKWDYRVSDLATCYAPHESWIEHIGRYGDGVNGESADRALNFIGYK